MLRKTDVMGESEQTEGSTHCLELTAEFGRPGRRSVAGIGLKTRKVTDGSGGRESSNDLHASARGEIDWEARSLGWAFRVERNSDFGTQVAPSLTARARLGGRHLMFAHVDRSYNYPSFAEVGHDTLLEKGDPAPGTQHTIEFEIGYSYAAGILSFETSLYWQDADRVITYVTDETCGTAVSTDSESEVVGIEISAGLRHPLGFECLIGCAAVDPIDGAGQHLDRQSPYTLTWDLGFGRRLSGHVSILIGFAGRWVSNRGVGSRFVPCAGAERCLADAELRGYNSSVCYGFLSIDEARVYASIRNLLNDDIYGRWGQPVLPQRSYEIGVTWQLSD
jgi:outer membrane cobalamin receptor